MTIRRDFPALNPAQVQQILGEYQLGPGKSRPRGWFPPPEEVEPALRTGRLNQPWWAVRCAYRGESNFLRYYVYTYKVSAETQVCFLSYSLSAFFGRNFISALLIGRFCRETQ